jgi:hypothetical protein
LRLLGEQLHLAGKIQHHLIVDALHRLKGVGIVQL